jgi:hypothetical protein
MSPVINRRRRNVLVGAAAGAAAISFPLLSKVYAQGSVAVAKDAYVPRRKLALLIGNGDYPNRNDILPARKNVVDLRESLEFLEFEVKPHFYFDLGENDMRSVISASHRAR